jgi:NAD+--asparagine ADP-ribosyltransferase
MNNISLLDSNRFNSIADKYNVVSDITIGAITDNIKKGKHSEKRAKQIIRRLMRLIGC